MRILVLNADYPRFLSWLYRGQPGLGSAGYAAQLAARNASLFGVADFYSRNFSALGHAAAELHVNNAWLQTAWAREHGMAVEAAETAVPSGSTALPGWLQRAVTPLKPMLRPLARKVGLSPRLDAQAEKILLAQIEDFKPDVVLNQDTFHVDPRLMRRIKAIGNPVLIGQIGIAPSRGVDWSVYDLMMSQLSATVEFFRRLGVRAEVNHLAFEPGILDALPPAPAADIDVSFVGTVSPDHRQRIALLEAVAERYDLKLFGNPPRTLPPASPLHRCFQGEVWGAEMYQALRRSKITLNSHIDMAGREAGNMRLFEATGVGAYLLTDFKENLHTLFEPDREVAVWRSVDDCLAAIDRALGDAESRAAIAAAGQARTMAHHTYRHRATEILGLVGQISGGPMNIRYLVRQVAKRLVKATPVLRRHILPSADYRLLGGIDEARVAANSSGGWFAARTVARQERAYRKLVAAMKDGEPRLDFRIAAEAVAATGLSNPRLLEIGCGSGYYSEVLATLLPNGVRYAGIDYSDAMIARARTHYPAIAFEVADATKIPYADQSFDIAFNGVSLMHILDYQAAIHEAARVARFCIFHSVPVFDDYRTTYLGKYAYGAPVVEVVFGKQELMSLCSDAGLRLMREWPGIAYDVHDVTGHHSSAATYLFAR